MVPALILAAAIAIGFALPPLAWGLRAWVAFGLPVAWAYALTPVTPFQNEGPLDGLASASLYWLFGLATLGVAARAFYTLAQAPLDLKSLSHGMRETDSVLAALHGLIAGVIIALMLAVEFRGMSGGLALHFAVAVVAVVAGIVALYLPLRTRCFAVSALATVACLTIAGGLFYPQLILSRAEVIQPGAPRCLRTPDGSTPTLDQMRLLTLPQALGRRPNLVLTVMTVSGPRDFRWSYRSFAFRTYDSYSGGPCPPP